MSTGSIQELDAEECRELLEVGRFGRVALDGDDDLELLPVNYAFADGVVMLRTTAGSTLASIVDGRRFVFEADHHDDTYQTGWSISVRGPAELADDEQVGDFGGRLPVSWAGGGDGVYVAITVERMSGRRVRVFPA